MGIFLFSVSFHGFICSFLWSDHQRFWPGLSRPLGKKNSFNFVFFPLVCSNPTSNLLRILRTSGESFLFPLPAPTKLMYIMYIHLPETHSATLCCGHHTSSFLRCFSFLCLQTPLATFYCSQINQV